MSRRHTSLRAALAGIALTALALTGCAASGTPSGEETTASADEGYITPASSRSPPETSRTSPTS